MLPGMRIQNVSARPRGRCASLYRTHTIVLEMLLARKHVTPRARSSTRSGRCCLGFASEPERVPEAVFFMKGYRLLKTFVGKVSVSKKQKIPPGELTSRARWTGIYVVDDANPGIVPGPGPEVDVELSNGTVTA